MHQDGLLVALRTLLSFPDHKNALNVALQIIDTAAAKDVRLYGVKVRSFELTSTDSEKCLSRLSSEITYKSSIRLRHLYSYNMSLWSIPPPPESRLKRYRVLSPLAGVRVSPIQLGAMSIGDKWNDHGMGAMDKESSFKLLDAFFEAGDNFIDTANNYQDESSEEFLGEWAETRGIRDQLVIATKYTTGYKTRDPSIAVKAVYAGNNRKSMHLSVAASLKKLRTSYIDILYLHWYDYTTSVEEIMDGLHTLVMQGKVLYLGVSDCPAWVVVKANQYARYNGKTPFCIYQGEWNVLERSFEREIIPMARSEGLVLAPFGVLAGGKIRTDEEEKKRKESGENGRALRSPNWERTEQQKKVCKILEEIAAEVGAKHITAVRIEAATPIDLGFPHTMLGNGETDGFPMLVNGTFDRQPVQPVITPMKQ